MKIIKLIVKTKAIIHVIDSCCIEKILLTIDLAGLIDNPKIHFIRKKITPIGIIEKSPTKK